MWFSKNKLIKLKDNIKNKNFNEDTIKIEESIGSQDKRVVDSLKNLFINCGYILSTGDQLDMFSYFEKKSNGILFFAYLPILDYSYQMFFTFEDHGIDIFGEDKFEIQENEMREIITNVSFLIIGELAYANYLVTNYKIAIEENTTIKKISQSSKNKKNKKRNKTVKTVRNINITNAHRIINSSRNVNNNERRSYERQVKSWTVHGHWRTYKSGKKVWIEPHTRKAKNNKTNKKVKKNYIIKSKKEE